jgi:hypothetical protein
MSSVKDDMLAAAQRSADRANRRTNDDRYALHHAILLHGPESAQAREAAKAYSQTIPLKHCHWHDALSEAIKTPFGAARADITSSQET